MSKGMIKKRTGPSPAILKAKKEGYKLGVMEVEEQKLINEQLQKKNWELLKQRDVAKSFLKQYKKENKELKLTSAKHCKDYSKLAGDHAKLQIANANANKHGEYWEFEYMRLWNKLSKRQRKLFNQAAYKVNKEDNEEK